jgi:hypothetical protein
MIETLKAKDFKPQKIGVSDKFSSNIFRFMCKHASMLRVFRFHEGEKESVYFGVPDDTGQLIGVRLKELINTRGKFNLWSFGLPDNAQEMTEEFWKNYAQHGACYVDGWYHNFTDSDDSNSRICEYCGKIEIKKVEMVPHEYWVAETAGAPCLTD